MQELSSHDLTCVSGGMSQTTKACLEGGTVGLLGGAMIGGVIASPAYFTLMNQEGISSSHHLVGWLFIGLGVFTGSVLGSFFGTGGGWLASCQLDSEHQHS